jgi:hypothetical protein
VLLRLISFPSRLVAMFVVTTFLRSPFQTAFLSILNFYSTFLFLLFFVVFNLLRSYLSIPPLILFVSPLFMPLGHYLLSLFSVSFLLFLISFQSLFLFYPFLYFFFVYFIVPLFFSLLHSFLFIVSFILFLISFQSLFRDFIYYLSFSFHFIFFLSIIYYNCSLFLS